MPSNHLILRRPLLLPSVFPNIRVFSSESALHIRWPKRWSIIISPSSEYSRLMVQFSHLYMTIGNTIVLTRGTFVGKMMSQLFNTLSRFVTAFLPGRKNLLISQLLSPSIVILKPSKKSLSPFSISPHVFGHEGCDVTEYHGLSFFNVEL